MAYLGVAGGSAVKNLPAIARDTRDVGSIPGLGRSPGEGHGNILQYSCLGKSMDRGTWRATVHRVAKSWTWQKWFSNQENMAYPVNRPTLPLFFIQKINYIVMSLLTSFTFMISYINNAKNASVQFSHSVISHSATHELQHARLTCPSPTPGACSNSCPSVWWCHLIISSSVIPFSSCLQSFPASGSFQMRQFTSGGQSIGASVSASVLSMSIQVWFPLGLTGLFSLLSKGLSRVFNTTVQKNQFFSAQLSLWSNSHIHTGLLEKP